MSLGATPGGVRGDPRLGRAVALLEAGRAAEAVAVLKRLAAGERTGGMAHALLGSATLSAGDPERASYFLARAAAMAPHNAGVLAELATALLLAGRPKEAAEAGARAAAIQPDNPAVLTNLGVALANLHDRAAAEVHLRRALELAPGSVGATTSLAQVLCQSGRSREAADLLDAPPGSLPADDLSVAAMRAFVSNYDERCSPARRLALHRAMAARLPVLAPPALGPRPATGGAGRRVRVGYLSPDFYDHPVVSFVEPLLTHHDRSRFEVLLYATHVREDAVCRRLRGLGHRWLDARALDDAALLARLRGDGLDVLIDLAGNTATNRLAVLAARAAPVQVAAIGYPCTTGLPAMDLRLADALTDPPAAQGADGPDAWHTERLLRLPGCFLCYRPHDDAAPVAPPPATRAGGTVTFGSFNNAAKIGPETLNLWAGVLSRVPGSRLLLKAAGLGDAAVARALRDRAAASGIDPARLELVGFTPSPREHLALYARVDIALDTTPYAGTTTTCEALDHGVPVVTLARPGAAHAARVGASLLAAAGLERLVAESPERYAQIAADLAADVAALASLRACLRDRLRSGPLCDGAGYARRFEAALLASLPTGAATP